MRMFWLKLFVMFVVVLGICPAIMGADKPNYASLSFGYVPKSELDATNRSTIDPARFSTVDGSGGMLFGIKFGHNIRGTGQVFGIELEYFSVHDDEFDNEYLYTSTLEDNPNVSFDASISFEALMLNFILRRPNGGFHPYVGGGLGLAWFDIENFTLILPSDYYWYATGTNEQNYGDADDDCPAFQFLLGADIDITENAFMGLGYRYFWARPNFRFPDDPGFRSKYKMHALAVTLGLRF